MAGRAKGEGRIVLREATRAVGRPNLNDRTGGGRRRAGRKVGSGSQHGCGSLTGESDGRHGSHPLGLRLHEVSAISGSWKRETREPLLGDEVDVGHCGGKGGQCGCGGEVMGICKRVTCLAREG